MLWYRCWLETRWRFVIGLAVLMCSVSGFVFLWPRVVELLGRRIRESVELQRAYRGYIWSQWFRQNLTSMGTLLAALLGTAACSRSAGEGCLCFRCPSHAIVWFGPEPERDWRNCSWFHCFPRF
jgi:hypothetical protein